MARAWILAGALIWFLRLFAMPMLYGTMAFVCGLMAVWLERPAAGVVVAAWGTVLVFAG